MYIIGIFPANITYFWLIYFFRSIPESVRWLLANEKRDKAKGIVCKAAKVNNVTLSESLLDSFKKDIASNVSCYSIFKKIRLHPGSRTNKFTSAKIIIKTQYYK